MKPTKRRRAARGIGTASRAARKQRDEFLKVRRAAVAAWRKTRPALDRVKEAISQLLEKARPRFEVLDAPILELEALGSMALSLKSPLEIFEELASAIDDGFATDDYGDFDEHIENVKGAERV